LGRRASEKDSGNFITHGNARCCAGDGACARSFAGAGHYGIKHGEIAPQRQASQAQQEHSSQIGKTSPRCETAPAATVRRAWLAKSRQTSFTRKFRRNLQKGERMAPLFVFSARSSANLRVFLLCRFASDTHRMRGVISLWFALSPVESYISFRGSLSSRHRFTPVQRAMQAEMQTGENKKRRCG
jgi:hypothetical protein